MHSFYCQQPGFMDPGCLIFTRTIITIQPTIQNDMGILEAMNLTTSIFLMIGIRNYSTINFPEPTISISCRME